VNSPEQSEDERVIETQLLVNNIQSAVITNKNFVIDTDIIKKYNKIYILNKSMASYHKIIFG